MHNLIHFFLMLFYLSEYLKMNFCVKHYITEKNFKELYVFFFFCFVSVVVAFITLFFNTVLSE